MNKENSSQNFQELYLEKYEPEKDVIWISTRVTEKSFSKGIEFENVNNSIFWDCQRISMSKENLKRLFEK